MELYIGNKNYSSWSMRPWLVLEHFGIEFDEKFIQFDDFKAEHPFKQKVLQVSPAGKVPALVENELVVWDSLAICEYLAEQNPAKLLWPIGIKQRAQARSICSEMHSGFQTLRTLCPMDIESDLSQIGHAHWQESAQLRADVKRIEEIWSSRPNSKGFLSGDHFTIADAFFAPVVMRMVSYALPVSDNTKQYIQTILANTAVKKWIEAAKKEHLFNPNKDTYQSPSSD